ncbi:salicylate hydroxylase [Capronia epimyces CBS 606.96]|uniref:Salicylate hydroxylase n=1 Tax=Capronia epimyces CBS 606.96 TaxID=1182542 RepID=W9XAN8_9EURO|nr:salicylate hydroxylase [Capronia epimyces CBS 606.96]EXJ77308.1 salicylate hydroxylase [Capronia epimyces CBS 606.96]
MSGGNRLSLIRDHLQGPTQPSNTVKMQKQKNFEIAIVGGGIAGLTLAIALYHRQVPVTIYEQAPQFGEIGAGVSFTPNAVQAMKVCHRGIYEAFERVCTRNVWPSKQKVWFDYLDGLRDPPPGSKAQEIAFSITSSLGQSGVHRARYLDEMVKLVPQDIARFGKKMKSLTEDSDGRVRMEFEDGTTASADAVIGCDGIKSIVRQAIVGREHPSAYPVYTHKYAYRGLVPMTQAVDAVGEELAQNACMHMGPNGHVLTFPVNHGQTLNIVAFRTSSEDWPDSNRLTKAAKREDALLDFREYGSNVLNLLKLTNPDLDVWAIFDLGEHPVPTFYKGRICLSGDAAHATSPHHGAGAGLCIEDSAVLAELLADECVIEPQDLEAVFETFNAERKERGQWLVQSSRHIGDCYEWRAQGIGRDFAKIEADINTRNGIIANFDVGKMCNQAREELKKRLK